MKKTYLAMAVAAASIVAQPTLAQDYQMEAGLSYTSISPDNGSSDSVMGLDFRYNLETVSTEGKPLAEAEFLGRNGGVNISYSDQDKADASYITLGGDYWHEDMYFAATYVNADQGGDKENIIAVKAGYMVDESLRLHVGLANQGYIAGAGYVNDETTIAVGGKLLHDLGGQYINLEGEFQYNTDYKYANAKADYYFANELSAGFGVTKTGRFDKVAVDVNAKYFVMPNVSGELAYTMNSGGVDGDNAINFRVAARF